MTKQSLIITAWISFFALSACTSLLKIHTDRDKNVDFSKYKTFTFYGFTDKTPGLTDFNRTKIILAVQTELLNHGYVQDEKNPDLLVNATAILKEKTKVSNTNYYGYGGVYRPYYWGTGNNAEDVNVQKFNEGSLIIDVLDASTKTIVWQVIGNKEIDVPIESSNTMIPDAVKKMMASFPSISNK